MTSCWQLFTQTYSTFWALGGSSTFTSRFTCCCDFGSLWWTSPLKCPSHSHTALHSQILFTMLHSRMIFQLSPMVFYVPVHFYNMKQKKRKYLSSTHLTHASISVQLHLPWKQTFCDPVGEPAISSPDNFWIHWPILITFFWGVLSLRYKLCKDQNSKEEGKKPNISSVGKPEHKETATWSGRCPVAKHHVPMQHSPGSRNRKELLFVPSCQRTTLYVWNANKWKFAWNFLQNMSAIYCTWH